MVTAGTKHNDYSHVLVMLHTQSMIEAKEERTKCEVPHIHTHSTKTLKAQPTHSFLFNLITFSFSI